MQRSSSKKDYGLNTATLRYCLLMSFTQLANYLMSAVSCRATHLTVRVGTTLNSCVRCAIFMLARALMTSPPSGCSCPVMICSCVVFPAPFTPEAAMVFGLRQQHCIAVCRLKLRQAARPCSFAGVHVRHAVTACADRSYV
jgi:hypothetical protein